MAKKKEEGNKILINSSVLNKALKEVGAAVQSTLALPIIGHIHCVTTKNTLTLMTTDMSLTIIKKVICDCSGEFVFLLPFKETQRKMANVADQPIEITVTENIVFNIERSRSELGLSEKAEHFPKRKELDNKYSFKADKGMLNAMNAATKCVISVEMGSIFQNVCLHGDGKYVSVVATDKHQLFRYKDEVPGAKMKVMVDSKFVKSIAHFEEADISGNDEYILAKSGDTEIITRLGEGVYADYSPYYPEYKCNVSLPVKDLLFAMNDILAFDNKIHYCYLTFKDKLVEVKYDDDDFNRHSLIEIPSEHKGEIQTLYLDCSILKNLLSIIKADDINIYIQDAMNPIHLDSEDENLTLIIMPLAPQS